MEWSMVFESASGPFSFSSFTTTPFESAETVQVINQGGGDENERSKAAEIRASSDSKKVDKTSTGKKGVPWTEAEHQLFLMGLNRYGKGEWKNISQHYVVTKTPSQVASHAQKFFRRQASTTPPERRRKSIHDIQTVNSAATFSSWPAQPQPPRLFGHYPATASCDLQSPLPPPPPFPASISMPYGLTNFSNNELMINNFAYRDGTSMFNQPSAANSYSNPHLN